MKEEKLLEEILRFWNGIAKKLRKSVGEALFPFCPPEMNYFKVMIFDSFGDDQILDYRQGILKRTSLVITLNLK